MRRPLGSGRCLRHLHIVLRCEPTPQPEAVVGAARHAGAVLRPTQALLLCQSKMRPLSCVQPLIGACRLLPSALSLGRETIGTTTCALQMRSLSLISSAARLTGSSSISEARKVLSYSSLRQRVTLRPRYLLALLATSHEQNSSMKRPGSGPPRVMVYICRSAWKCALVSGLAASPEKNTVAEVAFSSTSMPHCAAACLKMVCTFCRIVLVEVWNSIFSR